MKKPVSSLFHTLLFAAVFCGVITSSQQVRAQEAFIGEIRAFGFNFAPRGWAKCEGQLLPISQYSALFSLLGTQYGGDGRTTFGLPDLRGRAPIHYGQGPGLSYRQIGQKGGSETTTLTVSQMPAHTHAAVLQVTSADGTQTSPTNSFLASDPREKQFSSVTTNETMHASAVIVSAEGGGQAHDNMQPYIAVNYCICLTGIFPSRN